MEAIRRRPRLGPRHAPRAPSPVAKQMTAQTRPLATASVMGGRHGCADGDRARKGVRGPAPRDRAGGSPLGLDGLDHRLRMAVRGAEGPDDGRTGRGHLLGDRRSGDPLPGPGARGTRRDVPRLRGLGALPPLCVRRLRRRVVRLVRLAAGGHGRADRGLRHDPVRRPLRLRERLAPHRRDSHHLGPRRCRGPDVPGELGQLPGGPGPRADQQRRDLVEGRRAAGHDPGGRDRGRLPHLELHGCERVQPRRRPRHPGGRLDQRHHLQLPRLRAGRPARRREHPTQARHPGGGDRLHHPGPDHLHRPADRLHRGAARAARSAAPGTRSAAASTPRSPARGPSSPPCSASVGWPASSTWTRSSHRVAPA